MTDREADTGSSSAQQQHLLGPDTGGGHPEPDSASRHLLGPDTGGGPLQSPPPNGSGARIQGPVGQVPPSPNPSCRSDTVSFTFKSMGARNQPTRSTSTGPGEPRSRSRSPRARRQGASATITDMPPRSRSPTPTRVDGMGYSPYRNHVPYGMYSLSPPEITYDEVSTAPNSPTDGIMLHDIRMLGSAYQLHHHNKAVMVTPSGSLLAVNQSPLELRESTLTVNYPDCDDGEDVSLLYSRHEKIPMKDFAAEIRASLDVENFLNQAQLILDMGENNLEAIIDKLLNHLLTQEDSTTIIEEAKKSLFTHDNVHQLAKTIQGTCNSYGGGFDYDQSWVSVLCTVPSAQKRHVAIARLKSPANLGRTSQEVYFIILIVTPSKEKGTKNALETGRTFATLFSDIDLRLRLLAARTEEEFKHLLWEHMKELAEEQSSPTRKSSSSSGHIGSDPGPTVKGKCNFAIGLRSDFMRRLRFYLSDFKDGFIEPEWNRHHLNGFVGHRTIQKTASTTMFLYFACILPSIALGVLNDNNTKGKIDVKTVIYSQTIGGLFFALLGGQPMVILLTTAPLALYTKVIYNICEDWDLNFPAMYAATGMWNSFFLVVYAISGASWVMKWTTRSTEEIFSLFISIAFAVDAFKDVYHNFDDNYHSEACDAESKGSNLNKSLVMTTVSSDLVTGADNISAESVLESAGCFRENSMLFLLMVLGTVWLGMSIYNFTKTPFLNAGKRELLADYALPVSVLIMSFFGSYVFRAIKLEPFQFDESRTFKGPPLDTLPWTAVLGAMGMGFSLSLLFFMDQNISAAMVNSPDNKMKKGTAYHWDLLIVGCLNFVLTFFGLPMVHGALPHSPLHVRAMADVEDRVDQGHVYQKIMYVRETRVTAIFSHILIGLSLFLLPYPLAYIPRPVLDGLFLYLAVTALNNNQMFERIMLLVTEQAAYPPNHYIRSVPQRKVHLFTFSQLLQLAVMCGFGFAPIAYLKMVFPVLILLLLPVRHKLVPLVIEKKYLEALDAIHH